MVPVMTFGNNPSKVPSSAVPLSLMNPATGQIQTVLLIPSSPAQGAATPPPVH
jgi:hypothetical protein